MGYRAAQKNRPWPRSRILMGQGEICWDSTIENTKLPQEALGEVSAFPTEPWPRALGERNSGSLSSLCPGVS